MPAQIKDCSGCLFFAHGSRDHDGERFKPPERGSNPYDVGECRIRSTFDAGNGAFPIRYFTDWCAEFKRAEAIIGYEANGHLTTG